MTMHKELKTYSSIGNRAGILLLCKKVLTGRVEDISSIRTSCSFINGVELNFKCGIIAFEEIKLISVFDGKCKAEKILYSNQDETLFLEQLCRFCMNALVDMELINIEHLKYNEVKDAFQIPTYAFKLESAVFRNMLITFGALVQEGILFSINEKFQSDFAELVTKKRKISQETLLQKLENQRIMGEKGEEFVLNFEKNRCSFTSSQKKKIKRISIIDASAGFDILSLEDEKSNKKRYIEVKTYSDKVHFFWSANEIKAAKLRGKSYYLYIVNYKQLESEGYSPLIIPDPNFNIVGQSIWDMKPSSYAISTGMQENELKAIYTPEQKENEIIETKSKIINLYSDYERDKNTTYIPLYTIKAACGKFLYNEDVEILGYVDTEEYALPSKGNYFIVQAKGHSMEPRIQDGDYCLFEYGTSFYEDDIILAEIPDRDSEYGGSFTIKKYTRKKNLIGGEWVHSSITLVP